MKKFLVTTFSKKIYDDYAHNLIETYLSTKQSIPLVCYVEEDVTSYPQHEGVFYLNLFERSPDCVRFVENNKNPPKGFTHTLKSYRHDAVRFCYKSYSQYDAKSLGEQMFFIDADCVFLKTIPLSWYNKFLDGKCFGYYPRSKSYYTETGFIAYDLKKELVQVFFDRFIDHYNSGRLWDFPKGQVDCVVFDEAMNSLRGRPDFSEKRWGAEVQGHVMAMCPMLKPFIDHKKGERKNMKYSPEREGHTL